MMEVADLAAEAFEKEGLIFKMIHDNFAKTGGEDIGLPAFMLTSAIFHVCGEPCGTYESNQGLTECDDPYCDDPTHNH